MKAILNFFRSSQEEVRVVHSYKKVTTPEGTYTKREDGVEYFISSDLLN